MSRLPIRARLTAAFALAMVLVLVGAGLFVYLRLRTDLDDAVNGSLRTSADAVAALMRRSTPAPAQAAAGGIEEAEEGFIQVLDAGGRVLDSSRGIRGAALSASELRRALGGGILVEHRVAGIVGTARVLARPVSGRSGSPTVVVIGQSLEDRDEALSGVIASFAIGGPMAVVIASIVGYLLATAGLRPVEAMRRRAEEVSLSGDEEQLPLPAVHDEIRRLGETLNDMLGRLRRSFERERRFVADASHELRTPVAVVKTELEGALRTGDYGPQVRDALVAAVEECDHLAQLAEDLLVIARASGGQLPVRCEWLEAGSLLDGARQRFADRAAQHGVRVVVDAPDGLAVHADPLRLRQALGNLLDNALRHGAGEVVLAARHAGAAVEIDVSDHGRGFAADVAEQAFERFTRGDAARARGGAGLGLAIVRAIVEAHGGRAAIVSGPGATVRIWLPDPVEGPVDHTRPRRPAPDGVEQAQAGLI